MPRCPRCDQDNAVGTTHCEQCGAVLPAEVAAGGAHSGELEAELRALLAGGQKIEAIRRFREATGAGLAAAKEAVEALAAGGTSGADPETIEGELLALLQKGEKIAAIKHYRERTGAGLRDAKEVIEALARRHGLPARGAGCFFGTVLLAMLALGVGAALAAG
jgi:ribosomal protein L7/L12